jgi:transcriptional regulator GlxA family with amidase domain
MKPQPAIIHHFNQYAMSNERSHQRVTFSQIFGVNQPKIHETIALMEANLEEIISLNELAILISTSRRQLERLFQKHLNCSPSRYYLRLRLNRARQLLKKEQMPMPEVALACGFVSSTHFSKCYREHFGISPQKERIKGNANYIATIPTTKAFTSTSLNRSLAALNQAKSESTFASVQI